jgi:hypothetical protein
MFLVGSDLAHLPAANISIQYSIILRIRGRNFDNHAPFFSSSHPVSIAGEPKNRTVPELFGPSEHTQVPVPRMPIDVLRIYARAV